MEVDKLSFNEGLAAKLQNLTQQGSKIIAALIHGNHVFDVQTLKPPKTVFDLTNGFKSTLRDLEVYDSDGDRCLGPEDCKQDIYYIRGLPTETGPLNEWRHPFCTEDEACLMAKERVVRLSNPDDADECYGSAAFVGQCLLATARHCVVEDGRWLAPTVNGHKTTFVIASPYDDLAVIEVPEKASCSIPYQLAIPGSLQVGRKIVMVGYPLAWDQESHLTVEEPYIGHGRISVLDGNRAGGSYDGTFPNASGAAVVLDSKTLAGVHLTAFWHEDTSKGQRYGHEAHTQAPRELLERDINALWKDAPLSTSKGASDVGRPQPGGKRSTNERLRFLEDKVAGLESSLQTLKLTDDYLESQVQHKSSTGVFVAASRVGDLLKSAGKLPPGPLYHGALQSQKFKKRKK